MKINLVIIPTYNEKENIERMIRKVFSLQTPFEILILDDNSPDKTAEIVQRLQGEFAGKLHLLQRKGKLGLGTAYLTGFNWALQHGADYIFEMDCDFSHNPEDLEKLLEACDQNGADVSIGSRQLAAWPRVDVVLCLGVCAHGNRHEDHGYHGWL